MLNNVNFSVQLNDIMSPNNNLLNFVLACGNGSNFNLTRCNSLRCKFKADFQARYKAVSSVIKECVVPPRLASVYSHSSNLVYFIACDGCHIQYVGKIVQNLSERFNGHKTGYLHSEKHGTSVF